MTDTPTDAIAWDQGMRMQGLWAWGERLAQTGCWEHVPSKDELLWSDNLFRIFGHEPGAVKPSVAYVLAMTHPDDRHGVKAAIRALLETGATRSVEHRIRRPSGERRFIRATLAVGEVRDGAPYRVVGIVEDLTDSRHAEREIAAHVAVEEALVAWEALEAGAERLVARLAMALDCVAGVFWLPIRDVLVPRVFWHGEEVGPNSVELAALSAPLRRGAGLPGRVWETAQPLAGAPSGVRPGRSRSRPSRSPPADPLIGAVAIPAVDGQEVLAVVELKADRKIVLGERLTRSLCGISHELGHFLARRGGELAEPLLTAREIEVLQLGADGLSARETAARLTISPATIRTHLEHIYLKLDVSDKSSAVATAMRLGIID